MVVRLVSKNVGALTAAELMCALWNRHSTTVSVTENGRTAARRRKHLAAAAARTVEEAAVS